MLVTKLCLTAKHLKQGYRYHKLQKAFSIFFIFDTTNWFLNTILDYKHFCYKAYRNLNFVVSKYISLENIVDNYKGRHRYNNLTPSVQDTKGKEGRT